MKNLLKPFSVFLSINILIVPLAAATPQNKSLKIHVGYIGEKLENVPDGYQKLVRQKMLSSKQNETRKLFSHLQLVSYTGNLEIKKQPMQFSINY